jgi:hypothetical protein
VADEYPKESAAIAGQRKMIQDMRAKTLPPSTGPNVGGVEPRVIGEAERAADDRAPIKK